MYITKKKDRSKKKTLFAKEKPNDQKIKNQKNQKL
jgi:hypothetical protein